MASVTRHQPRPARRNSNMPHDRQSVRPYSIRPNEVDVIIGRKRHYAQHLGNIFLQEIADEASHEYFVESPYPEERKDIVVKIIDRVYERGGKFIKRDVHDSAWIEADDDKAFEKARYAVRRQRKQYSEGLIYEGETNEKESESSAEEKPEFHPKVLELTDIGQNPALLYPKENDVLIVKGPKFRDHPGNIFLREIARSFSSEYFDLPPKSPRRKDVLDKIVDIVHGKGGAFIGMDDHEGVWKEIDEFRASERVRTALSRAWHKGIKNGHPPVKVSNKKTGEAPKPTSKCIKSKDASRETPKENDVVLGRGHNFVNHPGNIALRDMAKETYSAYFNKTASFEEKQEIINRIMNDIKEKGGRFVVRDGQNSIWVEVGDERAREKIRLCLSFESRKPGRLRGKNKQIAVATTRSSNRSTATRNRNTISKETEKRPVKKHTDIKSLRPQTLAIATHGYTSDSSGDSSDDNSDDSSDSSTGDGSDDNSDDSSEHSSDHSSDDNSDGIGYFSNLDETLEGSCNILENVDEEASSAPKVPEIFSVAKIKSEVDLIVFLMTGIFDSDIEKMASCLEQAFDFIKTEGINDLNRSMVYFNIARLADRRGDDSNIQYFCLQILNNALDRFDPKTARFAESRVAIRAVKAFNSHENLQEVALCFLSTLLDRDFAKEHAKLLGDENVVATLCGTMKRFADNATIFGASLSIFSSMLACDVDIRDDLTFHDVPSTARENVELFANDPSLCEKVEELEKWFIDAMEE